jgi:hypothetical protein
MAKLHEILAVENDKKAIAEKVLKETVKTFADKKAHFNQTTIVVKPYKETDKFEEPKNTPMIDTVKSKLDYTAKQVIPLLDVTYQKELANCSAKSDIVIGTEVLAKDVPATVLLNLEKRLTEIRSVYDAIPTLPPGSDWKRDESTGHYRFTDVRIRSMKQNVPLIKVEATKEHPAQVDVFSKDVPVADVTTTEITSFYSATEKSETLERVDTLIQAVKRARARANNTEVPKVQIGADLFRFVSTGKVTQAQASA